MAKSSKKTKEAATPDLTSVSAPGTDKPVAGQTSAAKPGKTKKRPQAAGKTAVARKPRATMAARKNRHAGDVEISDEDIRIRAYFISEQRRQSGVAGDSARDWLEACRQLQEEAGKSA